MAEQAEQRFFRSTRGQVILLLRRGGRTVNDLAAALSLTDNAIRAHLAALEKEGLVVETGTTPGVRRPHVVYALTPKAEALFPKAYETLLRELLTVMAGQLARDQMEDLLRSVGRRVASAFEAPSTDVPLRQRVEAAALVLGEIGGLADVEEGEGTLTIRGCNCPLQSAVTAYPDACQVAETLLSELIGAPVRECCQKGDNPRCCFEVGPEEEPR
jgi:predicted ArsR family transcriptional regulator